MHWAQYVERESRGTIAPPGALLVEINAPGIISVSCGLAPIASLRHGVMVDRFFEVFKMGPIFTLLHKYVGACFAEFAESTQKSDRIRNNLWSVWRSTLS